MMDKLLRKNWLVKIISFLIALMLYAIVSTGQSPSSDPSSVVSPTEEMTLTQKLNVIYDSNKYMVSGAPENVAVHMQGTGNLIFKARLMTKSAYIDLKGMKPGTYDVRVQTQGFPTGLTVRTVPKTVRIQIQKRTSKEFPVAIDEINKGKMNEGYKIGDPTIQPKTVTVTGGADTLDSIASVKGVVSLRGVTGTINRQVTLHAYDNNGNPLDVAIQPSTVQVQIPIGSLSKKLGIQAAATGNPANGYSVSSVDLSPGKVMVTAPDEASLKSITSIAPLSVSVDGLKADKTFNVTVPLPVGATSVTPSTVKVTIHISQSSSSSSSSSPSSSSSSISSASGSSAVTKEFRNIPVNIIGVKNGQTAKFDSRGAVDVSVTGNSNLVDSLSAGDIQAQVNAGGLDKGDNQAAVILNVPSGLTATCHPGKLGVTIS